MKKKLKPTFLVKKHQEIEVSLRSDGRFGEGYSNLDETKRDITLKQYSQDATELQHEDLKEKLKHHEDAINNIKVEMAALKKDLKEDKSDVSMESEAAKTKKEWDKIDKKELKKDTKKEKEEHEKDAVEDDKSKIKKLEKGKPSAKKSAEKKALKRDEKFDKKSEKTYAQILNEAAEQYAGK